MNDPLLPHLLDIITDPASEGLILTGGFGIRIKQASLRATEARTLIPVFPEARATQDLDFFLSLSLFVQKERGTAVRALFDRLQYTEYTPQYQFGKPFRSENPEPKVKIDLLARSPSPEEGIRVKGPRVGSGAGIELHGRETPEGFAVEERLLAIPVSGARSDGQEVTAQVLVPHPYAWINLKVKAAHDWLRMERGEIARKPNSEKHAFDVYVLTAMLTESELEAMEEVRAPYWNTPIRSEIQNYAFDLFGSEQSQGFQTVVQQANVPTDYATFYEALRSVLGS
ncbi:MAG: nucleotidyl transferase AbiEii/AbiGii toxin family protein [Armatimonadetes bacterium]|nr:nucleotidyl transferase AbiEii/AbiGii toxin family protein [Armatimonadota bacterium]